MKKRAIFSWIRWIPLVGKGIAAYIIGLIVNAFLIGVLLAGFAAILAAIVYTFKFVLSWIVG